MNDELIQIDSNIIMMIYWHAHTCAHTYTHTHTPHHTQNLIIFIKLNIPCQIQPCASHTAATV